MHFIEVWNSYWCLFDAFSAPSNTFIDAWICICRILKPSLHLYCVLKYAHILLPKQWNQLFRTTLVCNNNIYLMTSWTHNLVLIFVCKNSYWVIDALSLKSMPYRCLFQWEMIKGINIDAQHWFSLPVRTPEYLILFREINVKKIIPSIIISDMQHCKFIIIPDMLWYNNCR